LTLCSLYMPAMCFWEMMYKYYSVTVIKWHLQCSIKIISKIFICVPQTDLKMWVQSPWGIWQVIEIKIHLTDVSNCGTTTIWGNICET
jgi:glycerol kinase